MVSSKERSRGLTLDNQNLAQFIVSEREKLLGLRSKSALHQLKKTDQIKKTRRAIARALTKLRDQVGRPEAAAK